MDYEDEASTENDVKLVFKDLAAATSHLRSVISSFPRSGHLKGLPKQVMKRSKVGLKAFTSTFKFIESHLEMKIREEDSAVVFVLVFPTDVSSTSPSEEVDITDLVKASLDACSEHNHIGEDTRKLYTAMHGVMSKVLQRIPEKNRLAWKMELLREAIKDESNELVRHAEKVVFGEYEDSEDAAEGGRQSTLLGVGSGEGLVVEEEVEF